MTVVRTRGDIMADWFAGLDGSLTAADSPDAGAALAASHDYRATQALALTGQVAYWLTPGNPFITQDERDKAAAGGAALPDGSYPITTCDGENSVDTAIAAVGRGGADHDAIRRHIMKRADSLGCASKIPDNWNADGSLKDAGSSAAEDEAMRSRLAGNFAQSHEAARRGSQAFAPPPPPPPASAAPEPKDGGPTPKPATPPPAKAPAAPEAGDTVDAGITAKIDSALTAVQDALKAQQADPDAKTDPKDAKVLADLQHAEAALTLAVTDQKADAEGEPGKPKAPPAATPTDGAPPKPTVPPGAPPDAAGAQAVTAAVGDTPGNAEGVPGDGDDSPPGPGDIEADVPCENPDCQHMAAAHEDLAEGKNAGACSMEGCACPGMVLTGSQVNGPGDDGGGPNNAGGDDDAPVTGGPAMSMDEALAANRATFSGPEEGDYDNPVGGPGPAPGAPQAPAVEGAPAAQLPPLDAMPTAVVGPPFTIPVMWLEGVPTGDGRMIEGGSMTWRTPPLPLMGLKTSPHDPSGMSGNDPAVLIGRIEAVEVNGNKGVAKGHLLSTEEGEDFATILEQMGRMGVSIDVGSAQVQVTPDTTAPPSADVFDIPLIELLVKGEVMGATVCPFAAFAGAYIVLGDGSSVPEADLAPAPAGSKMAIHLVETEVCEPCEGATALVASGAPATTAGGPIAPPREWFEDPAFGAGDPRLRETLDSRTGKPSGKFACPITVTPDGRVFGHIAQWGVCHQSAKFLSKGQCVMAPRSSTGYALFHNGHIVTAEGESLAVGKLTADAGHASDADSMPTAQVLAHYDNSAMTAALVRAGEDEYGIWVAGSVHPAASPEQVVTLRANPPSGDWRPWGTSNELRAVLHVNSPGFPLVQAEMDNGRITSLVAAGVPLFAMPAEVVTVTDADRLASLERAFAAFAPVAVGRLKDRMAALRAS